MSLNLTHDDADHHWGPVEYAHFTGNPHRKCRDSGCSAVTLDLHDDEITNWTVSFAVRNVHGVAWISEVTVYACEDTVEDACREEIEHTFGAIKDLILVDFIRHLPEEHT